MTSPRRLGCAAVLLAAALVPALGSQARAESLTKVDEAADVTAVVGTPTQSRAFPAPRETRVDITSADFDYAARFLSVRIDVTELRKVGKQPDPLVRVKGGGVDWTFIRGSEPGSLVKYSPSAGTKPCRNGTWDVTPRYNFFTLRVPAACFGTPDSVRVGAAVTRPSTSNPRKWYVDDVRATDGYNSGREMPRPILGNPNLARG